MDDPSEYGMEFDADEWYEEADMEDEDEEYVEEEQQQEVINVPTALEMLEVC